MSILLYHSAHDSDSEDEAVGARRDHHGAGAGAAAARHSDGSDQDVDLDERLNDPKLGAKKRAKLEAKAEKRAHREVGKYILCNPLIILRSGRIMKEEEICKNVLKLVLFGSILG
jgi:ribosome assembly protein YihI (activator of Der GTPase)